MTRPSLVLFPSLGGLRCGGGRGCRLSGRTAADTSGGLLSAQQQVPVDSVQTVLGASLRYSHPLLTQLLTQLLDVSLRLLSQLPVTFRWAGSEGS